MANLEKDKKKKQDHLPLILLITFVVIGFVFAEFHRPVSQWCSMILMSVNEGSRYTKPDPPPVKKSKVPKEKVKVSGVNTKYRRTAGPALRIPNKEGKLPVYVIDKPQTPLMADSRMKVWSVLGPFNSPWKGETINNLNILSYPFFGVKDVSIDPLTLNTGALKWTMYRSTDPAGCLACNTLYPKKYANTAIYLAAEIDWQNEPELLTAMIGAGSMAFAAVNGKEVWRTVRPQRFICDSAKVKVPMKKGKNLILVKLVKFKVNDGWNFSLRFERADGNFLFLHPQY